MTLSLLWLEGNCQSKLVWLRGFFSTQHSQQSWVIWSKCVQIGLSNSHASNRLIAVIWIVYHDNTIGVAGWYGHTNRREAGIPNFPQISNNSGGVWKCPARRERNKYRWRKLSNLRFADDVALTTEDVKDMEHQLNTVNEESLKIGFKIHKGKTNFLTNIDTTEYIQINGTETEKATYYKYLGQTTAMENRTKQEVSIRITAEWSVFGKYR